MNGATPENNGAQWNDFVQKPPIMRNRRLTCALLFVPAAPGREMPATIAGATMGRPITGPVGFFCNLQPIVLSQSPSATLEAF
ncbi:hypothetical protein [Pseudomonas saponiphila]|uniref:hypothetical protein n=1 Tax=Pseudomonas saponiphila TaxID=556534 RepID=UPI00223FB6C7|nr:hypothetical protein [Pseudomonas saponiphila]